MTKVKIIFNGSNKYKESDNVMMVMGIIYSLYVEMVWNIQIHICTNKKISK